MDCIDYRESNDKIIMNEVGRTYKEAVLVHFKVLRYCLTRATEENLENLRKVGFRTEIRTREYEANTTTISSKLVEGNVSNCTACSSLPREHRSKSTNMQSY
jgi:predicted metal-binding protein